MLQEVLEYKEEKRQTESRKLSHTRDAAAGLCEAGWTYMQNKRTARHSVHRFVEKSCGGGRVSATGPVTAQLLLAYID